MPLTQYRHTTKRNPARLANTNPKATEPHRQRVAESTPTAAAVTHARAFVSLVPVEPDYDGGIVLLIADEHGALPCLHIVRSAVRRWGAHARRGLGSSV